MIRLLSRSTLLLLAFLSLPTACGGNGTDASATGDDGGGGTFGGGGKAGGSGVAGAPSGASGAGGAGGAAGMGGGGASSTGGQAGTSTAGSTGAFACSSHFADCDGDPANGCEVDLTDAKHCGGCDNACPTAKNADATCTATGCGFACQEGFGDCDVATPGCETDVWQSVSHCGSCETVCEPPPGELPVCSVGTCLSSCLPGMADCDNAQPGCETDTRNDPKSCGVCGKVCSGGLNAEGRCIGGLCKLGCDAGWGDCDGSPSNGCESLLVDDASNCGACGNQCDGACISGACACAGSTAIARPIPLDMYVMLDKSGSMLEAVPGGSTRWVQVTQALSKFVSGPSAGGTGVAIQYFPLGSSCDPNKYANPAVPMGELPGTGNSQLDALVASIAKVQPSGGTPSQPALRGAIQYAREWAIAYPEHKVLVVLATDGEPQDCGSTLDTTAAEAASGVSGSPAVPTYVIGVGSALSNLDSIAQAGGTGQAFIVNDGDATAFQAAMKSIQSQALGCEYTIPPAEMGGLPDFDKVNVQYSPGAGSPTLLSNVADAAACTGDGWFYDNPAAPKTILLCPATCTAVSNDIDAKIEIILGCTTKKD
jgi:hypothetical protein